MKQVHEQKNLLKKNLPDFLKKIEELAVGAHIKLEKLMAVQIYLSGYMGKSCTITASTRPATQNDRTYLTQNFDTKFSDLLKPVVRFFFTRKPRIHTFSATNKPPYRYVYLGLPLVFEIPLLNEKGLGFGGAATRLVHNKDEVDNVCKGIPTYLLDLLTMMTCSTVEEVENLWKNTTRSSCYTKIWPYHWDFETSAWCDRQGGILMIEQTHHYIATKKYPNSSNDKDLMSRPEQNPPGILCHTNHHIWLSHEDTGSVKGEEEYPSSSKRLKRACELLKKYAENNEDTKISEITCQILIRDHKGGYYRRIPDEGDICRHPNITIFAWIVDSQNLTVTWTRGQPCRCKSKFRIKKFTFKH